MISIIKTSSILAILFYLLLGDAGGRAEDLRIGVIGTDSSHAVEFTRLLNDSTADGHVAGAKVVAAYRGGNPKLALSGDRIERFSNDLRNKWQIPFVESIHDLCSNTDGLAILSVDPGSRIHEFEQAARCQKPIFVDKPAATSVDDLLVLNRIAEQNHIRWFSASALRFLAPASVGRVASAEVWGPGTLGRLEDGYKLDLSWYAIHSLELLSAAMGPGIKSVSRIHAENTDILTAVWEDDRVGIVHLIRPDSPFQIILLDEKGAASLQKVSLHYGPLVSAIVQFFSGKRSSVWDEQTLELFAVMAAADTSLKEKGRVVPVDRKHFGERYQPTQ